MNKFQGLSLLLYFGGEIVEKSLNTRGNLKEKLLSNSSRVDSKWCYERLLLEYDK